MRTSAIPCQHTRPASSRCTLHVAHCLHWRLALAKGSRSTRPVDPPLPHLHSNGLEPPGRHQAVPNSFRTPRNGPLYCWQCQSDSNVWSALWGSRHAAQAPLVPRRLTSETRGGLHPCRYGESRPSTRRAVCSGGAGLEAQSRCVRVGSEDGPQLVASPGYRYIRTQREELPAHNRRRNLIQRRLCGSTSGRGTADRARLASPGSAAAQSPGTEQPARKLTTSGQPLSDSEPITIAASAPYATWYFQVTGAPRRRPSTRAPWR